MFTNRFVSRTIWEIADYLIVPPIMPMMNIDEGDFRAGSYRPLYELYVSLKCK